MPGGDQASLRSACSSRLPAYMVPAQVTKSQRELFDRPQLRSSTRLGPTVGCYGCAQQGVVAPASARVKSPMGAPRNPLTAASRWSFWKPCRARPAARSTASRSRRRQSHKAGVQSPKYPETELLMIHILHDPMMQKP